MKGPPTETVEGGQWRRKADPLVGAVLQRRFRVEALLAEGGLAAVYRAVDRRRPEAPVVVKVLLSLYADLPEARRCFRWGADLTRRFGAAVGAPLRGEGQTRGRPWVALDLLPGESLKERMRRGLLPTADAVAILDGLLDRVAVLHAAGIVHRDLKPAHVQLTGDGVRLLDLDAACPAGEARAPGAHLPFGSPAWTAPEAWADDALADPRGDLYSIGVMAFELLVGRRPFVGDPMEVLAAHAEQPVPSPRSLGAALSPELEAWLMRSVEKDPARRFPSAEAMRAALDAAARGGAR